VSLFLICSWGFPPLGFLVFFGGFWVVLGVFLLPFVWGHFGWGLFFSSFSFTKFSMNRLQALSSFRRYLAFSIFISRELSRHDRWADVVPFPLQESHKESLPEWALPGIQLCFHDWRPHLLECFLKLFPTPLLWPNVELRPFCVIGLCWILVGIFPPVVLSFADLPLERPLLCLMHSEAR